MRVYVEAIGLCGPGLANWPAGRAILAGNAPYERADVHLAASELLPQAERRRMTDTVKLAIAIAGEAVNAWPATYVDMPSVFASSGGDGATITTILEILASPEREVSPTRFHNSVHNAPSGYWSIATQSRGASTSLGGHDFSFAIGLLDAAAQAVLDATPVLMVSYDLPYPSPLHETRPIGAIFGTALILSPKMTDGSLALLDIGFGKEGGPSTTMEDGALEKLRMSNPAARSLPLLEAIAKGIERRVLIPAAAQNHLTVSIQPVC